MDSNRGNSSKPVAREDEPGQTICDPSLSQNIISDTVLDEYHVIDGPEPAQGDSETCGSDINQPLNSEDSDMPTSDMEVSDNGHNNLKTGQLCDNQDGATTSDIKSKSSDPKISSANVHHQAIPLPHVDCPEKIILCLDLSNEMNSTLFKSRSGDKYSALDLARRAIKMFVMHKSQMNPKHQFAFLVFKEEATMIHSFTSRAQDILNTLNETEIEPVESDALNLKNLFETIKANVTLPQVDGDPLKNPPPYIVRTLLLYGRSNCVPVYPHEVAQQELESSPYFFTDVLYIHEPPTEVNKCEEIFKMFCDLDHNGLSYIFEQSKYTQILNSGAKLLAHPLQRPRQLDAQYKIGSSISSVQPISSTLAEEKVF